MVLVSVTRVLNEDDIIEAFVRHTLAFVDRMVLLDNGSVDRSLEILTALRGEGLPLILLRAQSVAFNEQQCNTMLYHVADKVAAPDWVFCLDADEFIDDRGVDWRGRLAAIPPEVQMLKLQLRKYFAGGIAADDLLVPRRMVVRDGVERAIPKCVVRGRMAGVVSVMPGNHDAWVGDQPGVASTLPDVYLAHYPERHPLQGMMKAVVGRLKVLAAGGSADDLQQRSVHYHPVMDAMCQDPARLLRDAGTMTAALPQQPLVVDPIRYAGGALRYTLPQDAAMKAIRCVAVAAERLATSHGRLMDADPAIRSRVEAAAMQVEVLAS
jgi:hypothetical protein